MVSIWRATTWTLLMMSTAYACAQEIYVCVDSKGRRLTSDRPIVECQDREQKVLGAAGTVKRVVGRSLSTQEQSELDEVQRREADEQARIAEDKHRDRVLYARYTTEASHQKVRMDALAAVDVVTLSGQRRVAELTQQHRELDSQLEFYKKDPAKVPAALRHKVEENARNQAAQQRFLAEQEEEKKRINLRFDAEAAKLRSRWAYSSSAGRAADTVSGSTGR